MSNRAGIPNSSTARRMLGWFLWIAFIACVPLSNWLIANVGTTCVPSGPCLIPVWPGILAPSGVLLAGLSFVLRDFVQEAKGLIWSIAAVIIGGIISGLSASPILATASIIAFLLAEMTDLLFYTASRRYGLAIASVASSIIALLLDSIIFVWIAFGQPEYILGQAIGKSWMVLLTLPLLVALRHLQSGVRSPAM